MVREASAVVEYICAKDDLKSEKLDNLDSLLAGSQNHSFIGLITMERLIESILSITIRDEKDLDRSADSCTTSIANSHYSGHLNLSKVS